MNTRYTMQDGVKAEVLAEIKRRVPEGYPISKKELKEAYRIVRANAIADTIIFKRLYITIEETEI